MSYKCLNLNWQSWGLNLESCDISPTYQLCQPQLGPSVFCITLQKSGFKVVEKIDSRCLCLHRVVVLFTVELEMHVKRLHPGFQERESVLPHIMQVCGIKLYSDQDDFIFFVNI